MLATLNKASLGQGYSQSIVQHEIKAGNFLNLVLNVSPTGLIANTICS
jgi:hypothetical protein